MRFPTARMRRPARFLVWVIPALVLFCASPLVRAQVTHVTVAVDGMSCPFCAFGVEKKLRGVEGVSSVEIDLKSGKAGLTAAEGQSIRIIQVPGAIKAAGFTPGTIEIAVLGTIKKDDRQDFLVQGTRSGERFVLLNIKEETRKRLEHLSKTAALVRIRGIFRGAKDTLQAIEPHSVEEVSR